MPADIDICIPTFRRQRQLEGLIRALARQDAGDISWRVVVVDNDPLESARGVVERLASELHIVLHYGVEPRPGVVHVRNRALAEVTAPLFAFVDDDETVGPDWLRTLVATQRRFGADAVFGPVFGLLPALAPAWARGHPFFRPESRPTGTALPFGFTNNVLVRTQSLGEPPARFDERFALTGGEDTDFFDRLHRSGRRLVWCQEAVAYEEVPAARLQLPWLLRRALHMGQTHARIFVARRSAWSKLQWATRRCIQALGGAALVGPLILVSRARGVRLLTQLAGIAGEFSTVGGQAWIYEEYGARRRR